MTITAWLPGWERKPLGPGGGTYDELLHPKVELHTWEGTNWAAAEKSMAAYPSHCAANWHDRIKRQYQPLNKHSYANKGPENDDELIIQFEMAGFSSRWNEVSDAGCRFYGDCIKELTQAIGAPIRFPSQGFHGPNEGIFPYISSTSSPIRFKSEAELRAFSGICGHQHMPKPDTHWDPGLPPFDRMGLTGGEVVIQIPEEEDMGDVVIIHYKDNGGQEQYKVTDYLTKRSITSNTEVAELRRDKDGAGTPKVGLKVVEVSTELGEAIPFELIKIPELNGLAQEVASRIPGVDSDTVKKALKDVFSDVQFVVDS